MGTKLILLDSLLQECKEAAIFMKLHSRVA